MSRPLAAGPLVPSRAAAPHARDSFSARVVSPVARQEAPCSCTAARETRPEHPLVDSGARPPLVRPTESQVDPRAPSHVARRLRSVAQRLGSDGAERPPAPEVCASPSRAGPTVPLCAKAVRPSARSLPPADDPADQESVQPGSEDGIALLRPARRLQPLTLAAVPPPTSASSRRRRPFHLIIHIAHPAPAVPPTLASPPTEHGPSSAVLPSLPRVPQPPLSARAAAAPLGTRPGRALVHQVLVLCGVGPARGPRGACLCCGEAAGGQEGAAGGAEA